ncbi:hypothetical protein [Nesterenkonia sp.]|uniref:hypothetical protein n=1 Tax=Nesterenkonia sp. TaxID=704201 RepID=UPI002621CB98|nr:hypothetical protein [Nesterenkonia sp.]
MPDSPRLRCRLTAAAAGAAVLLSSCSSPPPPAPEPTGAQLERAWRIAVGEDPLDQTIAQLYAQVLNAHETPAVVVEGEQDAASLAAALAEEPEPAAPEEDAEESPAADERYEMVLARTMPLAEQLDAEGYAALMDGDIAPAAAPGDLTGLVQDQLTEAELLEPAAVVMGTDVLVTTITAEQLEVEAEEEASLQALAEICDELTVGTAAQQAEPAQQSEAAEQSVLAQQLEEVYDCEPEELVTAEEDELIDLLITAEIDAALLSRTHPGAAENALVDLPDEERAFAEDQYVPVVSVRISDQVPDVVDDVSRALNEEALESLRRLTHGPEGLSPEEAAEYWLVEHGFIAAPDSWG